MSSIQISNLNIAFVCEKRAKIKNWIKKTILEERKIPGDISIIFTSDEELSKINIKYLNHSTLTDVITFSYNENEIISGDIFISTERVRENAIIFNQKFNDELFRVIIHGVLHLLSYNDKKEKDRIVMKQKEEKYLGFLEN